MAWEDRPIEIANLFNPAFCSLLLYEAVGSFQSKRDEGIPYVLSFLVLPLTLHKGTRDILPRTTRTKLHVWVQENPKVTIGFAQRTQNLVPITKEALIFGVNRHILKINKNAELILGKQRLKKPSWQKNQEVAMCYSTSRFIGSWLAQSGATSTILTMLGVKP